MNGFILESKSILESAIWRKPPLYFKVWHYLLLNAFYEDRGNLKRGQLFTTYDEVREACSYKVGFRKEMPSVKEVRDVFDWLRKPHEGHYEGRTKVHTESHDEGQSPEPMIVTTRGTHGMVVTIVKYNDYQDPTFYERHSERQSKIDTKGTAKGTPKVVRRAEQGQNIKKEYKELKNNKPPLPPFDVRLSNLENFNSILDAGVHGETEYLTANMDLVTGLREWFEYKDNKKPKSSNHYDTQMGITKLMTTAVENAKAYGVGEVRKAIDLAIQNNWQGIVWDRLGNQKPITQPNPVNGIRLPPKLQEAYERWKL